MFLNILLMVFLFGDLAVAGNVPIKEQREREPLNRASRGYEAIAFSSEQDLDEVVYTGVTLQEINEKDLLPAHLVVRESLSDEDFQCLLSKLPPNEELKLCFEDASLLTWSSLKTLGAYVEADRISRGLSFFGVTNSLVFQKLTFMKLSVTKEFKYTRVLRQLAPLFHRLSLLGSCNLKAFKKASQLVYLDLQNISVPRKRLRDFSRKFPALTVISPEANPLTKEPLMKDGS
ncbi:MAG: hypothetical protein K2P93_03640 [Alphaproteobacteria bacterium]|nr:hypothetical protein [Alphaproteobacteria bacterium]